MTVAIRARAWSWRDPLKLWTNRHRRALEDLPAMSQHSRLYQFRLDMEKPDRALPLSGLKIVSFRVDRTQRFASLRRKPWRPSSETPSKATVAPPSGTDVEDGEEILELHVSWVMVP